MLVVDINDNSPQFVVSSLAIQIPEDTPVPVGGVVVGTIQATDNDDPNTVNAEIEFSSPVDTLPFVVNPNGSLTLIASLDFETQNQYTFPVVATDKGQQLPLLQLTLYDISELRCQSTVRQRYTRY